MNDLRLLMFWLIAASSLSFASDTTYAQTAEDSIKQDKVRFLYPLSAFIKSSQAKEDETLIIGVLGKGPFEGVNNNGQRVNHLDEMARESNADRARNKRRRIVIQRLPSMEQYQRCHLLFVSNESATNAAADTPEARLAAALEKAKGAKETDPVLLVADTKDFAQLGAAVNFYTELGGDGSISVRTELNPEAAKLTGFDKINPQFYERLRSGKGRIVR